MKKALTIPFLAAVVAGCGSSSYRDSADLEVGKLVADRTQSTLGYSPQAEVARDIPVKPAKTGYARIPTSPLPPPTMASPVERNPGTIPYLPLGPELRWMDENPLEGQSGGMELLDQQRERGVIKMGPLLLTDHTFRLDLFGVLEYAVRHSPTYRDKMDDLYLSALNITLQRHMFTPIPYAKQALQYTRDSNDPDHNSAMRAITSAGLKQQLPYGGQIAVDNTLTFVDAINGNVNNGETANVALTGTIPLLRGAGMINLEGLINSERQLVYQVRTFEDYRRSFVVDVAGKYFQLLAQQQGVTNRRLNLSNLSSLTERTQALFDAQIDSHRLTSLDVQRAMQSRISAENDLYNAEAAYESALDDFKVSLGMPVEEMLEVVPVELDVTVPQTKPEAAVALAHQYRLDLRTAADKIEDAQRGVKNAENGFLPQLDINAGASVGNEKETAAAELNGRTAQYSAGVTLDLPVDRVVERNIFRQTLIGFERARRQYSLLQAQIANDVRASLRSITTARLSVQIQRRGIDLAQRRLEFSNELLRQGKIDSRDVVDAQTSLLDAQDRYEQARSNLQIRILTYMKDTGLLRVDPKAGAIGAAMDRTALQGGRSSQLQ